MEILIDESKKDTKLPAILNAALKLFVERGIDGTSIRDIATAAAVAEGALYRHFKSKEELAWHLFATNLKAYTSRLLATVIAEPDTRQRIRILVHECFSACEKNRTLFYYLILSEHRELAKFKEQEHLHPGKLVEQLVAEGQRLGALRPGEPWVLFSVILGTIHRMCVLRSWDLIKVPLTDLAEETAHGIWKGVAA